MKVGSIIRIQNVRFIGLELWIGRFMETNCYFLIGHSLRTCLTQ
jgi:hypothetical protein